MAEPKAPKMTEMVAVHALRLAGNKRIAPGAVFGVPEVEVAWLIENGAATRKAAPAAPAPAPTED